MPNGEELTNTVKDDTGSYKNIVHRLIESDLYRKLIVATANLGSPEILASFTTPIDIFFLILAFGLFGHLANK